MNRNPMILLGITGSIAACKAAELASELTRSGSEVSVVMTRAAREFVAPLTFQILTGRAVGTGMFAPAGGARPEHIDLARRAGLVLIAPATANIIGKIAHGIADDLLTTLVLATRAPVMLAPAMNPSMWASAAVQANVALLRARGVLFVEPGIGPVACGESGQGRMAEPSDILKRVRELASACAEWQGVHVLVTAGPTREPLDGVRFISNPSSGKMGFALATESCRRGADVVVVTGPTALADPAGAAVVRVTTGAEMRTAVLDRAARARVLIMSAAVTDYRPAAVEPGKTKGATWDLRLEKVGNILAEVAARSSGAILVGFAAETGDPEAEGARKLKERGLHLVVANDVSQSDGGFGADTNRATLIFADGRREKLPLLSKTQLAARILDEISRLL